MAKFSLLLFTALLTMSYTCSPEEVFPHQCLIANESTAQVKVLLHRRAELPPYDSVLIAAGETSSIGTFVGPRTNIYSCDARKIQFIFENGKGYICTSSEILLNDSEFCFSGDKDPFLGSPLPNDEFGSITVITQEDFENAFDL